jgi:hypothetical protein
MVAIRVIIIINKALILGGDRDIAGHRLRDEADVRPARAAKSGSVNILRGALGTKHFRCSFKKWSGAFGLWSLMCDSR